MKLPSVTTVLGVLNKAGLPWGAANETASFALHHQDEWATLPAAEAWDRLRKHHRGVWDHRAALGTLVHSVNEAWCHGETVDVEIMVKEAQTSGRGNHIWARMSTDQVVTEALLMVDGLEAAWNELQPETISAEDVVRYPKPERQSYIGQHDWRARIGGRSFLLDVKTTGKTEADEGFYWPEWRLQLAAYRGCTEIVHYDTAERIHRPYSKGLTESRTSPLPPVETCGIVHIRANGEWGFYEVAAAGTEHNQFLRLRDIYGFLQTCKDGGVPMPALPEGAEA